MIRSLKKIYNIEDKRVVLLQSGGLDSCFLASLLHESGFEVHHLFIDYGQNARVQEKKSAESICSHYGGTIHYVTIDMPWLKQSSVLAGHKVGSPEVPKKMGCVIAKTYVPMRNHVFLSIASSLAESLGIKYIASGIDGDENFLHKPLTGCPDKHPTFVRKLEKSITEGSTLKHMKKGKYTLITPLVGVQKEDTICTGLKINAPFELSWSCYNDSDKPCGKCSACIDRKMHFDNLGLKDPSLK